MKSFDNAFDIIESDPVNLKILNEKSNLINSIRDYAELNNMTQLDVAKKIGTEQSRISRLFGGHVSEFSLGWIFKASHKLQE